MESHQKIPRKVKSPESKICTENWWEIITSTSGNAATWIRLYQVHGRVGRMQFPFWVSLSPSSNWTARSSLFKCTQETESKQEMKWKNHISTKKSERPETQSVRKSHSILDLPTFTAPSQTSTRGLVPGVLFLLYLSNRGRLFFFLLLARFHKRVERHFART